jgi:hypothetical protein
LGSCFGSSSLHDESNQSKQGASGRLAAGEVNPMGLGCWLVRQQQDAQ